MARDRFRAVEAALRAMHPQSDPLGALVNDVHRAGGFDPQGMRGPVRSRSEDYLDALSEADPRDLSASESVALAQGPSELNPNESEPDYDADDYAMQTPGQRSQMGDFGQTDIRLRDGRMMEPGEALGFNGSPAGIVGQANYMMRGYMPGTQRVDIRGDLDRLASDRAVQRMRGGR